MKFLLNAMTRARSKWLCYNLQKYLNPDQPCASDWFSDNGRGGLFIPKKALGIDSWSTETVSNQFDEARRRVSILSNSHAEITIKIHPNSIMELIAIEQLKVYCDRYWTIFRRDKFEHCVSAVLSLTLQSWTNDSVQKNLIAKHNKEPIFINTDLWKYVCVRYDHQREYLINEQAAITIAAEDTLAVENAEDFCKLLQLPFRSFDLDNDTYGPEWFTHKSAIIANYEWLRANQDY